MRLGRRGQGSSAHSRGFRQSWRGRTGTRRAEIAHISTAQQTSATRNSSPGRRHDRMCRRAATMDVSACRTNSNVSRIARLEVLWASCSTGLRWSWRYGAAAHAAPTARISQYETSKPLCDRLVYASGSARLSVEAGIGGPPTRGVRLSGARIPAVRCPGLGLTERRLCRAEQVDLYALRPRWHGCLLARMHVSAFSSCGPNVVPDRAPGSVAEAYDLRGRGARVPGSRG